MCQHVCTSMCVCVHRPISSILTSLERITLIVYPHFYASPTLLKLFLKKYFFLSQAMIAYQGVSNMSELVKKLSHQGKLFLLALFVCDTCEAILSWQNVKHYSHQHLPVTQTAKHINTLCTYNRQAKEE